MKWLSNLSIGSKFTLCFSIMVLILMAVVYESYITIDKLNAINKNLFKTTFNDEDIRAKVFNVLRHENAMRADTLRLIIINNATEHDELLQDINERSKIIDNEFVLLLNASANNSELKSEIESLKGIIYQNEKIRFEKIIPLIKDNKIEEAKNVISSSNYSFENMRQARATSNDIVKITNHLGEINSAHIAKALKESDAEEHEALMLLWIVAAVSIFLVVSLVLTLNYLIARPLKLMSEAANQISAGNLRISNLNPTMRRDEIGILADSFELMSKNLQILVAEMIEAIELLATSSSEISTVTSELVSSVSETAASVSETTTTIEEVKQTSHLASQKAKSVSENTAKTANVSETGKNAANEINAMINQINTQMEMIAQSMLRLTEQSQAIGTIITTVDDLAQQSNLLSVNASIEAAKAGEHGKGFSVVAQEVKSLAMQSKQATNQVRSLLNDIQKAATASVMATEQGSKTVGVTVTKSVETRDSIMSLVASVKDASNSANQILVTSQQQLVGMEQAAEAMENIKQASEQNVESVKQLESAVNNIKNLGIKLKGIITQYNATDIGNN